MKEDTLYRKVYSDFTGEEEKDDIYTISFNNNKEYKGEFKIRNLAIYHALTVYCDVEKGDKFVFNEAYMQSAFDPDYKMNQVDLDKYHITQKI